MFSTLPMEDISINSNGDILYHDNKGYEDPWRKHHTSPITRDIWDGGVQPADIGGKDRIASLLKSDKPFAYNKPQNVMSAAESYAYVLDNVGATIPRRDNVDATIIQGVRDGLPYYAKDAAVHVSPYSKRRLPDNSYKLGIITDPQQTGGLPQYNGTPRTDTDNDGMPDDWETAHRMESVDHHSGL